MPALTQSLEDYLEAIYVIGLNKKVVRVKELAGHLKVKTPSVVDAISKLVKRGYVEHEKYGYLDLTEKGYERAKSIYSKHEEIYKFLVEVLGVNNEIAKDDACDMEHHISKETMDRMIKFMEFIESCPEGYPEWLKSFEYYAKSGKRPKHCPKKTAANNK